MHIKYRARSACKNYSCNSFNSCSKNLVFKNPCNRVNSFNYLPSVCGPTANLVFKKSRVQAPVSALTANKNPCDPCDPCAYKKQSKIRVRIKYRVRSACKNYSCNSFNYLPSVSGPTANLVFRKF